MAGQAGLYCRGTKNGWVEFTAQATLELCREAREYMQRGMVQPDTFDQSCRVARQDRDTANVQSEDFSFPFEIRLAGVDGLVCEREGIVHLASNTKEGADGLGSNTRIAQNRCPENRPPTNGATHFRRPFLPNHRIPILT